MTATAVKAYKIASGDTLTNLEKAVNQFIAGGWQPYGPPFLTLDNRMVQALIIPAGPGELPASAKAPAGAAATPAASPAPVPQTQAPQAQAPAGLPPATQSPPQRQAQPQPVPVQPRQPQQPNPGGIAG